LSPEFQRSYFKSSFDLKKDLDLLWLQPNAQLFSTERYGIYVYHHSHRSCSAGDFHYLATHELAGVPAEALVTALRLVMKNNVFTFGDTTWKQAIGTAMGTPPAPPYATLYFAIHKDVFLNEFGTDLIFYKRFIDDCV
jgi:hypothetical protein